MIKNIFFPQKIGNKFFITQSFNVFEYNKKIICISGKNEKDKVVINKLYHENLLLETADVSQLVNDLIEKKSDENIILLPDNLVYYRKIFLPLTDRSTIKNIINFEMGSTLPFDINNCFYDFFVIPAIDRKNCTVWVTFIIKEVLHNFLEPFENINLSIKSSLPAALDLIKELNIKGHYIVCYQNGNVITVLYFFENLLNDVFLVSPESFDLTLSNIISSCNTQVEIYFFNDIEVKNKFSYHKIDHKSFKNVIINVKNKISVPLLLIGAAMRSTYGYNFSLVNQERSKKENLYQFLTFLGLVLAFMFLVLGNLILNKYKFNSIEKRFILDSKKELNKVGLETKKNKLPLIIKDVEKEIREQENIWNAFSKQKRFSYLSTLSELTNVINKEATGLKIKKLSILPNIMTLEGSVRDFVSLQILEEEINKSPYFKTITPLQETSFIVNIMVLRDGVKA